MSAADVGALFEQLNAELSAVVDQVRRSVVQVRDGQRGIGAGTIWHSDGLIVTNAHVVRGAAQTGMMAGMRSVNRLEVALADGQLLPARVIAIDDERDLAALSVNATGLPVIEAGSARRLHAGEWVFAVGHPWGVTNAATGGVVIRVGQGLPDLTVRGEYLVADLHLRPGNSGGPIVDTHGRMVGVSTLMTGLNVGVAVTVEQVKCFLRAALGDDHGADSARIV